MGWQGLHTNFAVGYSRIVTGGGGLLGAFHSNSANASARWQLARTWTVGAAASYAIYKNVTPFFSLSSPGGHTVSGTVSVQHPISEYFNAELGYTRLHQSYSGIAVISNAPDANREFVSVSYQFARPLGR
jgi:outer membrane protein assembly factor BamA